jgi:hypothetical protein
MAGSRRGQTISTQLGLELFEQFILPHLSTGSRGPTPKLGLFKIFNYILQLLYLGCQWKELPIDKKRATQAGLAEPPLTAEPNGRWSCTAC